MKILPQWRTVALISTSLVSACGGGGSSGNSSSSCPNMAGTWQVVSIDDNTKCGGSVTTNTRSAVVTQSGCSFTMTSDVEVVTGTGSGNQISATSIASDSYGIATGTFTGTASADGNTVTGTDSWIYKTGTVTCDGMSQMTATRLSVGNSGGSGGGGTGGGSSTVGNGGTTFGSGGTVGAGGSSSSSTNSGLCSVVGVYSAANVNHVIVSGSYAYVAEGSSGIQILDVSNPAAPKAVGALPTTNATRLAINGSNLYVADNSGGLKVIDVSNPANPQLVANPTLSGSSGAGLERLALAGSRLYAAFADLEVFDVTNPASPVGKGSASTTFLEGLAVDGTLIYAATADGLEVFSSLSTTPFLASSYKTSDWGQAIALSGGFAYYGSNSGLSVFDISSPASPTLAASTGLVKYIKALSVQGSYLYASDDGPGLSVVDISNPKVPSLVGRCGETSATSPGEMAISGQHGYVADSISGVVILNLLPVSSSSSDGTGGASGVGGAIGSGGAGTAGSSAVGTTTSACSFVGYYPAVEADHVIASGTHAYVAEGASGIEVLDISNPASPRRVGSLPSTNAMRLAISGSDLYVADGSGGLKVIDVSNPASPQLVAAPALLVNGPSEVHSLALGSNLLYAAYIGLNVFDVSTPASPTGQGSLSATFIQDLAVDGTLVYAATASGLEVFSAATPANPSQVGSYANNDWGSAVAVSAGYAYYGSNNGLTVIDVSQPSSPTLAASSGTLGSIKGLTIHGNYLYVSNAGPGLSVVDISNPKVPTVVAKCGELAVGAPESMTIWAQYGLIAGGTGGLVIVGLTL